MPIVNTFPARVSIRQLLPILNSVGAHVAAKLASFGTDERTLTDDLCDMFYIWARTATRQFVLMGGSRRIPSEERAIIDALPDQEFEVTISKTSQQEEATVGADLALKITTPLGVKRALMQAKVYDPQDDRLRCDSSAGWDKLWGQLVLMRQRSQLAFLLIYLPANKLNGSRQGFGTWEQGGAPKGGSPTSSKFGATLIPVDDLLDRNNNWCLSPPAAVVRDGQFCPAGMTLGRLVLEMLICRRGKWLPPWLFAPDGSGPLPEESEGHPVHYRPYREISMAFKNVGAAEWGEFVSCLNSKFENLELE